MASIADIEAAIADLRITVDGIIAAFKADEAAKATAAADLAAAQASTLDGVIAKISTVKADVTAVLTPPTPSIWPSNQ